MHYHGTEDTARNETDKKPCPGAVDLLEREAGFQPVN